MESAILSTKDKCSYRKKLPANTLCNNVTFLLKLTLSVEITMLGLAQG